MHGENLTMRSSEGVGLLGQAESNVECYTTRPHTQYLVSDCRVFAGCLEQHWGQQTTKSPLKLFITVSQSYLPVSLLHQVCRQCDPEWSDGVREEILYTMSWYIKCMAQGLYMVWLCVHAWVTAGACSCGLIKCTPFATRESLVLVATHLSPYGWLVLQDWMQQDVRRHTINTHITLAWVHAQLPCTLYRYIP